MKKHPFILLLLLSLTLALAACRSTGTETATPAPTIDPNQIAQMVLAELEPQLSQPTPTPVPTIDPKEIAQTVLKELEPQLTKPTASPVPTVDVNAIREAVLSDVETRAALAAAGAGIEGSLVDLYQQTNPAVVFIVVPFVGSGSGFVYSEDGHIVTNNHVVDSGETYEVIFSNGERMRAELTGTDVDSDLAVIKVDRLPEGVRPLPLAEPEGIRVGQLVVAIGNPFGEQGSMSLGIISGLGRSLRSQREIGLGSSYSLPEVVQTDAPINPGNSGGPLLNLDGEVVGVNTAIASITGINSGVGFSVPVAAVRQIVPSLIESGAYVYPYMGLSFAEEITLEEQEAYGLPQTQGAYVVGVATGSPAEAAGLIPADPDSLRGGDLIIKLDDRVINSFSDLNGYLVFHTTPGQTIEITVIRDGEQITLPLTLGARP